VPLPPYPKYVGPPVEAVKKWEGPKAPKMSVVIPVRDRGGSRLRNCLRSLQLQSVEGIKVIVVDYGSTQENHLTIMETAESFNCTVYRCKTDKIWSMSISRNIGLRRTIERKKNIGRFACTLDVDCILERDVIKTVLNLHKKEPRSLVVSTVWWLPSMTEEKLGEIKLPRDYDHLHKIGSPRTAGHGALMSAKIDWWKKVRGFDERMRGWGADDDDIKKRAKWDHMTLRPLERIKNKTNRLRIFHQWHPNKGKDGKAGNVETWRMNKKILKYAKGIVRNDKTWGAMR